LASPIVIIYIEVRLLIFTEGLSSITTLSTDFDVKMIELVVRKAKKSDFNNIKHLIKEHFERGGLSKIPYKKIRKNTESEFKKHVGKEGTFVLVLRDKTIGYLSVGVSKNKQLGLNEGEIYMIHIVKEFRGRGYSHIMMKTAEEYLKKKKADSCIISTHIDNKISQSLYKKYGYKPWRLVFKRWNK